MDVCRYNKLVKMSNRFKFFEIGRELDAIDFVELPTNFYSVNGFYELPLPIRISNAFVSPH